MTLFNDSLATRVIHEDGSIFRIDLTFRLIEHKENKELFLEISREDDLFWLLVHEVHSEEFSLLKSE